MTKHLCASVALSLLLAGCGAGAAPSIVSDRAATVIAPRAASQDFLYVLNAGGTSGKPSVTVYAPNSSRPVRTIVNGISGPSAMVLDKSSNLYVANATGNSVTEYATGSTRLLRTIADYLKQPSALAIGKTGALCVANSGDNVVNVYLPGSSKYSLLLYKGVYNPKALAFDVYGDLYILNYAAPGHGASSVVQYYVKNPTVIRTFRTGIIDPSAMLVGSGEVFVADQGGRPHGNVEVFPNTKPGKWTQGIFRPTAMAFGRNDDLYVLNSGPGNATVAVFLSWAALSRTIILPTKHASAIVLDSAGNVYVAETSSNAVVEYQAGTSTVLRTIVTGVSNPIALALGPR